MKIGIDLDNTIICYDNAFSHLARYQFDIPEDVPRTKKSIKDYLIKTRCEDEWTLLQAELYGPSIMHALPYKGAIDCLRKLQEEGHELMIVSHKTMTPIKGPKYQLRTYASDWINHYLSSNNLFIDKNSVVFCETLAEKVNTIEHGGFSLFLDDLSMVLEAIEGDLRKVLFSPLEDRRWNGLSVGDWDSFYHLSRGLLDDSQQDIS